MDNLARTLLNKSVFKKRKIYYDSQIWTYPILARRQAFVIAAILFMFLKNITASLRKSFVSFQSIG